MSTATATALKNNVTRIETNNKVYSDVKTLLRSYGLKSKNSLREYERDLRQFFGYMKNKQLENLTVEDLKFTNSDVVGYQIYLSEEYVNPKTGKGYKNNTVNRKMATVQSLYNFLKRNDYDVNPDAMKVDSLPDDTEGYGFLTFEEVEYLAELALLTERENKNEKRVLLLLDNRTSLRKDSLLKLEYSDIRMSENDDNVYIIEVNDKSRQNKGKKIYKEISKKMYDILMELKCEQETKGKFNNKIFHINSKYVNTMMNRLIRKAGFDKRRNIKFHSVKKSGIGFVKDLTNDLQAAADQGDHSSVDITRKMYLEGKKNIAGLAMDERYDSDIFKKLTYEECVKLLESIGNGLGLQLKRAAKKIVDERNNEYGYRSN